MQAVYLMMATLRGGWETHPTSQDSTYKIKMNTSITTFNCIRSLKHTGNCTYHTLSIFRNVAFCHTIHRNNPRSKQPKLLPFPDRSETKIYIATFTPRDESRPNFRKKISEPRNPVIPTSLNQTIRRMCISSNTTIY